MPYHTKTYHTTLVPFHSRSNQLKSYTFIYHIFLDCSWTVGSTCFHRFSASLTLNILEHLRSIDTASHSAQPLSFKPFLWYYYSISLIDIDGFDMFRARHCFASCFQNSSKFQCRVPAVLSTGGFWDLAGPLRQSLIVGKRHRRSLRMTCFKMLHNKMRGGQTNFAVSQVLQRF